MYIKFLVPTKHSIKCCLFINISLILKKKKKLPGKQMFRSTLSPRLEIQSRSRETRKIFLNCGSSIAAGGYQLQGLYFITDPAAAQ